MTYAFKNIDYIDFVQELERIGDISFNIDKTNRGRLSKTSDKVKAWQEQLKNFLHEKITPDASFFEDLTDQNDRSIYDSFTLHVLYKDSFEREIKVIEGRIELTKKNIKLVQQYISICDSLNGKDVPHIYSIQDKIDFILEKLNDLRSESYHSVETILKLNDIDFNAGEPAEIAVLLTKKGYVQKKDQYNDDRDTIKITVKGSAFIERKIKSKLNAKTKKKADNDLNKKIDEVIERLVKLGYGQEIIFEELEEMRDLQTKLPKKSWAQLLKGKLIDLAVAQVINKEVATNVFKFLTNEGFKMLK